MKKRFWQMGLLILVMLAFSATAFATPNWVFVEKDETGKTTYVDLNSITAYNRNPNIVRFSVMDKNPTDMYSMLMNIEKHQWTYFESAVWGYPGQKFMGWEKQNLSWDNYDREWPIPKIVLSNYNSQPSQQVSEPSKSVRSSNTVTNFTQEMGNMHLVLARKVEQGVFPETLDLLSGQSGIRAIVLSQLNNYDSGFIQFKLDNGQYVGISVSYDGKVSFEGEGCQPREIQGGVVTYHKGIDGYLKKWSFDGWVSMSVLDGGRLGITFYSSNNARNFVVALPNGAQYLTGIVEARNINAEVAFYK
jgi:hypothetical protein